MYKISLQAVNNLVTELEQANITCTATITFAENDYKEQLRTLKVRQATTLRSFFNVSTLASNYIKYNRFSFNLSKFSRRLYYLKALRIFLPET